MTDEGRHKYISNHGEGEGEGDQSSNVISLGVVVVVSCEMCHRHTFPI